MIENIGAYSQVDYDRGYQQGRADEKEALAHTYAELEEHDAKVRTEMLGEVIKAIDESNYCMLEDCPFYKQCGYHLCPLDSNGLTIIMSWLEKWMEQLKEQNDE